MTGPERGFLLLSSHLGDPARKPLTVPQLRLLHHRVQQMEKPGENRDLSERDLIQLGYSSQTARQILGLLEEEDVLDYYLAQGRLCGCVPMTKVSEGYPAALRNRLGAEAPGCLWAKGDLSLLSGSAVALVGSRELGQENRKFAEAVGIFAAQKGLVLVSGNARGADRAAQNACLNAGGSVISIVADELTKHSPKERTLYISEDGFEEPFSTQRALSRNRCIHALGQMVFVAQARLKRGGTWQGTAANLRHSWSPVLCFRDGSEASRALEQMGAYLIGKEEFSDFSMPEQEQLTIF